MRHVFWVFALRRRPKRAPVCGFRVPTQLPLGPVPLDSAPAWMVQYEVMVEPSKLQTERLTLEPLTIEHTEALGLVYSDPEVARYVGGDRLTPEIIPLQVADFAEEWKLRGFGQSAVIERASEEFIGRIGLHYWPGWNEIELGYILATKAQGRGLAFEGASAWIEWAKSESGIEQLIANIHPDNRASIGLATKLGFTFDRHDTTPSGIPTLIYRLDVSR